MSEEVGPKLQGTADEIDDFWAEAQALGTAQAKALKEQASKGGLRFEVYLPSGLAQWVLNLIERGVFIDPAQAIFEILREYQDLAPHADLRREILRRSIHAAINDPHPGFSLEEVRERLDEMRAELRQTPAVWERSPRADDSDP